MQKWLQKANVFFDLPLSLRSRIAVLVAVVVLIPAFLLPLWSIRMYSNQFPDGLNLYIYTHKLEGGQTPGRDDLREINTLNHYIGMRPLLESDFSEFNWIPLVMGFFAILALRTVVIGKMAGLVDVAVLFMYFGLFSFWSFHSRLYQYGHNLSPEAPVKLPPFMPPLFGSKQLANFTVYSYPHAASFLMLGFFFFLAVAVFLSRKKAEA